MDFLISFERVGLHIHFVRIFVAWVERQGIECLIDDVQLPRRDFAGWHTGRCSN